MGRYTYWNAALESVGMAAAKKGRPPGLVKFTEKLYEGAVSDFAEEMDRRDLRPSAERYAEWCAAMNAAGYEYPSPSSLRNFFGSWSAAFRIAQGVQVSQSVDNREPRPAGEQILGTA